MQLFFNDDNTDWEVVVPEKVKRKIKAYDKEIMMVEVFFENGAVGAAHVHPHEQATYCLDGEFDFTVGDITKRVKAGDTIYMPPDILHGCKLVTQTGRLLDVFTPYREDFLD